MTADSPFKVVSDTPQCGNCVYYFNPSKAEIGLCRRYPPLPFAVGMQTLMNGQSQAMFQSQYPGIYEHGYCGEHVKRPSVEQAAPDVSSVYNRPPLVIDRDGFFGTFRRPSFDYSQHLVEPVVGPAAEGAAVDPGGSGEDGS